MAPVAPVHSHGSGQQWTQSDQAPAGRGGPTNISQAEGLRAGVVPISPGSRIVAPPIAPDSIAADLGFPSSGVHAGAAVNTSFRTDQLPHGPAVVRHAPVALSTTVQNGNGSGAASLPSGAAMRMSPVVVTGSRVAIETALVVTPDGGNIQQLISKVSANDPDWPALTGNGIQFRAVCIYLGEDAGRRFQNAIRRYLLCRPITGGYGNVEGLIDAVNSLAELSFGVPDNLKDNLGHAEVLFGLGEATVLMVTLCNFAEKRVQVILANGEFLNPDSDPYLFLKAIYGAYGDRLEKWAAYYLDNAKQIFVSHRSASDDAVLGHRIACASAKLGDLRFEQRDWDAAVKEYRFASLFLVGLDKDVVDAKLRDALDMKEGSKKAKLVIKLHDRLIIGDKTNMD